MDLTKLTVAEYKSANEELQRRIKDLQQQVVYLKKENGDLQIYSNNHFAEVLDLKSKISYKEEIIRKYQSNQEVPIALVNSSPKLTKIVTKSPIKSQRFKVRQKAIYGILKNKTRYRLNDWEVDFLTSIAKEITLHPKQHIIFEEIKERGKFIKK